MKNLFIKMLAATTVCAGLQSAASAHDFSAEIAQFNKAAATKKIDSKESIAARIALERSYGVLDQADVKMLLRIRSLTNSAFRELGEQPAFLTSELKRLEMALANPKTNDAAKLAKARDMYQTLMADKAVYDALDSEAGEHMKQALKLIETAPNK